MKRFVILLLVLPLWVGCNWKADPWAGNKEFTHTGCAGSPATKGLFGSDSASLLTLKYEDGGLRVTRTNAEMNCSIKLNGMDCQVSVEGNVIHYWVTEADGPTANCICLVEKMSSVVSGLQEGKEYIFDYSCGVGRSYPSFPFVFKKGFNQIIDLD